MTLPEKMLEIRAELGSDHEVAMKILTLLLETNATEPQIAVQLGLDPLEVARLMAKLERLGLVA